MTSEHCQLILDDVMVFKRLPVESTFLYSLHSEYLYLYLSLTFLYLKLIAFNVPVTIFSPWSKDRNKIYFNVTSTTHVSNNLGILNGTRPVIYNWLEWDGQCLRRLMYTATLVPEGLCLALDMFKSWHFEEYLVPLLYFI